MMHGSSRRPRPTYPLAGVARLYRDIRYVLVMLVAPGAGIRRWLLLAAIGGLSFAAGFAYVFRAFSSIGIPDFLPGALEAALFLGAALAAVGTATWRLTLRVGSAIAASRPDETLRESMVRLRQRDRGPRVVAIGGGTGLSTLLRGLKEVPAQVTGIVTVADDGGSSGRLREEFGVLPPGDIRNCIVALADAEPLVKDLFQYRFDEGEGLKGHSFGNLFILAMSAVTGSFEEAINASSRVLNVRGRIVPSTLDNVNLRARMRGGAVIVGESRITGQGGVIERLSLEPAAPRAYEGAVEAIRQAQMVVIGPGSLYTSIIPNLLVPGISEAIAESGAPVAYICNVATQAGETDGYTVAGHVNALLSHCPALPIDFVVANDNFAPLGSEFPASLVRMGKIDIPGVTVVGRDLMFSEFRIHHDPHKLANAVMDIYHKETRSGGRARRLSGYRENNRKRVGSVP